MNLETIYKEYLIKFCNSTIHKQLEIMKKHKRNKIILLSFKDSIKIIQKNKKNKIFVTDIFKIKAPIIDFYGKYFIDSYYSDDKFDDFIADLYHGKLNKIRNDMTVKILKNQETVDFITETKNKYKFIDNVKIIIAYIF